MDQKKRPQFFKVLRKIVKFSGMAPKVSNNWLNQFFYSLYSAFVNITIISWLFQLICNLENTMEKSVNLIMDSALYTLGLALVTIKMILIQRAIVHKLIQKGLEETAKIYENEPKIIQDFYEKTSKFLERIFIILIIVNFGAVLSFLSQNSYIYFNNMNLNENSTKAMPRPPLWYPFNANKHYFSTLIISYFDCAFGSIINLTTQVVPIALFTYGVMQLKILNIKGKNFSNNFDHPEQVKTSTEILNELRNLCIKHKTIIDFINELNVCLRHVLFVEFVINSLIFAIGTMQIIVLPNDIIVKMFYAVYNVINLVQLFLFSWYANEIQIHSMEFYTALYESNWYEQNKEIKKNLIIMMIRAKKPLSLQIGLFYPLTVDVAIQSLKATYSYITLLTLTVTH